MTLVLSREPDDGEALEGADEVAQLRWRIDVLEDENRRMRRHFASLAQQSSRMAEEADAWREEF